jgi:group II intron reverse transcriptase/maturase
MKDSREMHRKQTTSYEGYSQEVRVEPQGNERVQSISPASERRETNRHENGNDLLEWMLDRDNLNKAFKRVKSNRGSHGVDGMQVDELLPYLKQNGEILKQRILAGEYKPQPVRRVEIPKPDGGVRLLGIPTVIDRLIQQAIAQVLNEIFDKDFSEHSYGFRPNRSANQAVRAARQHIQEGNLWTVDMDLEKFFDRVNHDKLMSLVARKVKDKRVLKLIRQYLESGIMQNGITVKNEEGTPQGGPLSPLLANIMLDELDKELESRGHRFCRYADDCNIYVKSKKAGNRVMRSITLFMEEKLKLKVNKSKSAVDRPWKRKFLGFTFYLRKDETRIRIHDKSIERFWEKVKSITSRSNGKSMKWRSDKLKQLIIGWINYFKIADMKKIAKKLDEWMRRRIRMCYWKQWKKLKTKHKNLVILGVNNYKAWEFSNTRKGYWRISNSPILGCSITNKHLESQGFTSLSKIFSKVCYS